MGDKLIRRNKKKNGIVKLKVVVEKILLGKKPIEVVPEDVKEGHFAVIAEEEDETKRFVVPLSYLNHPLFLSLLEQAADEYGFRHGGALTIPCRPAELQMILAAAAVNDNKFDVKWESSCKTMVNILAGPTENGGNGIMKLTEGWFRDAATWPEDSEVEAI